MDAGILTVSRSSGHSFNPLVSLNVFLKNRCEHGSHYAYVRLTVDGLT